MRVHAGLFDVLHDVLDMDRFWCRLIIRIYVKFDANGQGSGPAHGAFGLIDNGSRYTVPRLA